MKILAIDPGPKSSGIVLLDNSVGCSTEWPPRVVRFSRDVSLEEIREWWVPNSDHVVCESIVSYSSVVGRDTFDTSVVIGRIWEMAFRKGRGFTLLSRPEIGRILCPMSGQSSPSGAQIAEGIREIYRESARATGGGSEPVKGTKNQPGPLYGLGLLQHEGSALAVGLAWILGGQK